MKKLFALLLALMMVLSLAACGGGDDDKTPSSNDKTPSSSQQQEDKTPEADPAPDDTSNDGYAIGDVSADNWEAVIAQNFGIEIALPDGWEIQEVSSPNGVSNVKIFFVPGGAETYDTFGETLFAACKTASTQEDMDKATFADTAMAKGTCSWKYYPDVALDNGQTVAYVQINYYDNGSNIEMTFQR